MALRFVDGFDHVTWDYKWNTKGGLDADVRWSTDARSGCAMRVQNRSWVLRSVGAPTDELIAGFALKVDPGVSSISLFSFRYLGDFQIGIDLNDDLTLSVTRSGSTLATSSCALNAGVWAYIEFGAKIHNTSGCYRLVVNGEEWLSESGVDTQSLSTPLINDIRFKNDPVGGKGFVVDDLYVVDRTGSVNNDFLGDVTVETLFPVADGTYTQWSPSPGGSGNYAHVDEAPPDDDATYVAASLAGARDTYQFQDLSVTNASIFGVVVQGVLSKDLSGSVGVRAVAYNGGSLLRSGSAVPGATSWDVRSFLFERDQVPGGGLWDVDTVNATEFGLEVV